MLEEIVCFVYQITNLSMKHVSVIIGLTPNNGDNINASGKRFIQM